jgi:uncharacterized membrane protein YdjX (TVP38/TMEM64 family)
MYIVIGAVVAVLAVAAIVWNQNQRGEGDTRTKKGEKQIVKRGKWVPVSLRPSPSFPYQRVHDRDARGLFRMV